MVLDEGHHTRWVGIQIIVNERVVETVESVPPGIGLFVLRLIQFVEEREVHHSFQIGVLLCKFRVLLPGCGIGRFRHPGLAHGVKIRVFLIEFLHPLGHGVGIGVRIGVHADAIDANGLNPPDTVLDEVAH